VKETHVFHLHLYEWYTVPQDPKSPRIDAISISPQSGHTIESLWGAGNRHQVAGDVIWHCHLYPHFHEGMWGMFRTFETRQCGNVGKHVQRNNDVYSGRHIGRYPDGTRIDMLCRIARLHPCRHPSNLAIRYTSLGQCNGSRRGYLGLTANWQTRKTHAIASSSSFPAASLPF